MRSITTAIAAFTVWTIGFSSVGCQQENQKLTLVVSTTMIEAIVEEVGGLRVNVKAIVPGGMCPGHFDISPSQMATITTADAFLYQGWETWARHFARSKPGSGLAIPIEVDGNWLIPDIHIEAVRRITEILIAMDPDGQATYEANAATYTDSIAKTALELKTRFQPCAGTKVLCSALQADFLAWLGLCPVRTFQRQEDLTPRKLADLVAAGRTHGVRLVVDNLQSGLRVGEQIAHELTAEHAVLSNFPLRGSYLETLRENANQLEHKLTRS